jgi:hypothetical protein
VSAAALAERLGRPRARRLALAALTLLALLLRFHAVYRRQLTAPNSPARLRGDERGYDALARELLAGEPLSWPGRTPGYPAWLAALHRLGGGSYDFIGYAQAVPGALVVPLTYLLARRWFAAPAALGAAAIPAVLQPLIQQAALLQSEVVFTPILLVAVLALDAAVGAAEAGRPAAGRALWAGALVGVADLVRPTLILFPAFAAATFALRLGLRRGLRYAALYGAAVALVVAPWTVRNWRRYHVVLPLATSNAILWQGSPEYYHLTHDRGYRYLDVWEKVLYGHDDDAPDPGDVAGERYWRDRAVRSIRAEPLTYLRYAVEKAAAYWVGDHNADWGDTYAFNYRVLRRAGVGRFETVAVLAARLLILPALLAAWVLRRRWRALLPVYAVLVYCTLLHAATHAEARLSEPLLPLLGVLIAGAAGAWLSAWGAPAASGS